MADLPTLDWEPNEDGGWSASIGVLAFDISGGSSPPYTLTIHWHGDWSSELCDSFEDAKACAVKVGEIILTQALGTLRRGAAARAKGGG